MAAVEILSPKTREEWLATRLRSVGASEAAALLGAHPFMTYLELWAVKSGRLVVDAGETLPMKRGRILEAAAVTMIAEDRPMWSLEPNAIPGGKIYRDDGLRLSCTPDLFAIDPARSGKGNVQIKSVEPSRFRADWQEDGEGRIVPPIYAVVQAIVEAHLTGATWAAVAALVVGFGIEVHIVDVPIHAGVIDRVRAAVAEFWRMVEAGEQPAPDFARDGELIADLFAEDRGTEIDLSRDNRLAELVDRRARLKADAKGAEVEIDTIDTEVKEKIGDNASAIIAGGKRITWRSQHRRAFHVEAKDFRVLRYPRSAIGDSP